MGEVPLFFCQNFFKKIPPYSEFYYSLFSVISGITLGIFSKTHKNILQITIAYDMSWTYHKGVAKSRANKNKERRYVKWKERLPLLL